MHKLVNSKGENTLVFPIFRAYDFARGKYGFSFFFF